MKDGLLMELSIPGKKEYVSIVIVSLLAASLNALWLAYTLGYIVARSEIGLKQHGYGYQDHSTFYLQLRIGIALAVFTYLFWLRNIKSLILSLLALVWIGIEFLKWYLYSINWLKSMGVTDKSQLRPMVLDQIPFFGGFYRGTFWTFLVLLVSMLLLFWVIKILLKIILSNRVRTKEE